MCPSKSVGSCLPLSPLFLEFYEKGRLKAKPNVLGWGAKERSQETRLTSRVGRLGCGNPSWLVVRPTMTETHLGWDIHSGTRMACSLMGTMVRGSLGFGRILEPCEALHQPIYNKTLTPCLPEKHQMPFWPETRRQVRLSSCIHRVDVSTEPAVNEPGSISGGSAAIPLPTQAREIPGTLHTQ